MVGQTMMAPCRAIDSACTGGISIDLGSDACREPPARRDHHGSGIRIVLGLCQRSAAIRPAIRGRHDQNSSVA
jgi:hypothetical protein